MAINFNPLSVLSGFDLTKLNQNFQSIKASLSDGLSRSGGSPNQMEADIDMNSNDLLNVKQIDAEVLTLNGDVVQPVSLSNSLKSSNALNEFIALGLTDEARDNLGLGDSATRDVGTTAGTVAAGDDSRITNSVQRNVDLGIDTSNIVASRPIPPGAFGGLFLANAFASSVWTYLKNAVDATAGPRFLLSLATRVLGGHANGPDQQRSILWLLAEKLNWDNNTALSGEIDVGTLQIRQGNLDDAGGWLIDGVKIFDAGSTGGLTAIEVASARQNWAGTVLNKVRAVVGFQEGLGGALNGNGASYYAEAETGSGHHGLAIVNHTASFTHAVAGFLSRLHTNRWFSIRYDGNPVIEVGSPADSMKLRYDASAIKVQDETGTQNHYVMAKDGIFRARAGMVVADNQATLKRVLTATASVDVASTAAFTSSATFTISVPGALVGDAVKIDVINNTLAGAQFNYSNAAVTSTGVVTVYPFNMSSAVVDPPAQTFRATVWGF